MGCNTLSDPVAKLLWNARLSNDTIATIKDHASRLEASEADVVAIWAAMAKKATGADEYAELLQASKLRKTKLAALTSMTVVWSLTFAAIGLLQSGIL